MRQSAIIDVGLDLTDWQSMRQGHIHTLTLSDGTLVQIHYDGRRVATRNGGPPEAEPAAPLPKPKKKQVKLSPEEWREIVARIVADGTFTGAKRISVAAGAAPGSFRPWLHKFAPKFKMKHVCQYCKKSFTVPGDYARHLAHNHKDKRG